MTLQIPAAILAVAAVLALGACAQPPNQEIAALRKDVDDLKRRVDELGGPRADGARPAAIPGFIVLENAGGAGGCKIRAKFPERTVSAPGEPVGWTVDNHCPVDATIEVFEPSPKPGNGSPEQNPFDGAVTATIPRQSSGIVTGRIKANLRQPAGTRRDVWTFKWRVNNAVQQDPELEVEY